MVTGVIYKYTSPSGKVYIGQTTDETHRRATWFCTKQHYAGKAIDSARAKYGPENFEYEVLHREQYDTLLDAIVNLDELERFYIDYYDSYNSGYNLTFGGDLTTRGIIRDEEFREKQRISHLGKSPSQETRKKLSAALKGKKHSKEASQSSKEKRRLSGRHIQIGQYDCNLCLVKVWRNVMEAAEALHIHSANIYRASKTLGMYMGFYWRKYTGEQKCCPKPKKKIVHLKQRKQVIQKTLDGKIVCIHDSVAEASKSVGKNNNVLINKVLHGRAKTAYGYIWEYLNCE